MEQAKQGPNGDLWQRIAELLQTSRFRFTCRWVNSHAKEAWDKGPWIQEVIYMGNEMADRLADKGPKATGSATRPPTSTWNTSKKPWQSSGGWSPSRRTSARGTRSRQKKSGNARAKTLRASIEGGTRTHDLSLEDAKRKGLDDLHESVRLDVMDLPGEKNLTYLNVSHQINWGWAGYEFRYKFSIPHCNYNGISL